MNNSVLSLIVLIGILWGAQVNMSAAPGQATQELAEISADWRGTTYRLQLLHINTPAEGNQTTPMQFLEIRRIPAKEDPPSPPAAGRTIFRMGGRAAADPHPPADQLSRTLGNLCYDVESETVFMVISSGQGFQVFALHIDAEPWVNPDGSLRLNRPIPGNLDEGELLKFMRAAQDQHFRHVSNAWDMDLPPSKLMNIAAVSISRHEGKLRITLRYDEHHPDGLTSAVIDGLDG